MHVSAKRKAISTRQQDERAVATSRRVVEDPYDRDNWATPDVFMLAMQRMGHRFCMDVCATNENTKCDYYIDRETDALASDTDWLQLARDCGAWNDQATRFPKFYCNPGYSNVLPWSQKAFAMAQQGAVVYLLAHDNFCGPWFRHAYNHAARIELLYPRIEFVPPPLIDASTNSRCSILLRYDPLVRERLWQAPIVYTNWEVHVKQELDAMKVERRAAAVDKRRARK